VAVTIAIYLMVYVGIDIGSRSIELVALEDGCVAISRRADTTFDPMAQCRRLLDGISYSHLIATGYGRGLLTEHFPATAITEIQAYALGARKLFPDCRLILDIGGQDTKAIALSEHGDVSKFEMNDRCAAGTGKFLEVMAASFQIPLRDFGAFALEGRQGPTISSMCTVFAESEVTSLMARGTCPKDVALAVHTSVVRRSVSMLKRVSVIGPLVFAGGVALNPCVRNLLAEEASCEVVVPDEPELVGALGAALYAMKTAGSRNKAPSRLR
jgi:predicted CoA-substrate-specific enzyme activase